MSTTIVRILSTLSTREHDTERLHRLFDTERLHGILDTERLHKGVPVETVNSIRLAVRAKRRALALSQEQVSRRAGVSRKWLSEFELGKVNVELGLVLRILETLDLSFTIEPHHSSRGKDNKKEPGTRAPRSTVDFVAIDLDALLGEYRP